jgi:FkbM family methyltransferase
MALKNIASSIIKATVKKTPWGVRKALLDGIAESPGSNRLLSQMAVRAQICGFMAQGNIGLIQAPATDAVLIQTYARTQAWATATVDHIRKALINGGTYLDIGANVGLTTIPIAMNQAVRCIAFEPEPTNFFHLSHNVKRNCKFENVELVQAAVMEKEGSLSFGLNRIGNPGDHRVVKGETDRIVIEVRGIPLDQYLSVIGDGPLAVKIDTQGAEPFVIAGGRKVLSRAKAAVIEFWPYGMAQLGGNSQYVIDFVRQFEVIELAKGESNQKQRLSANDAVAELSRLFDAFQHDLDQYWDLYVTRA